MERGDGFVNERWQHVLLDISASLSISAPTLSPCSNFHPSPASRWAQPGRRRSPIRRDSSRSNTSGGNHSCLQASHYRTRVGGGSQETESEAPRPAWARLPSPSSSAPHPPHFHSFVVFVVSDQESQNTTAKNKLEEEEEEVSLRFKTKYNQAGFTLTGQKVSALCWLVVSVTHTHSYTHTHVHR